MKRKTLYLVLFTSVAMALAVLGVTRYSIPMITAFPAVILIFALLAYFFVWRNSDRREIDSGHGDAGRKNRLLLLFIPLGLGAIGAVVSALQGGWNIGDTIGACVFVVLSLLIAYEVIRRNRNVHTSERPK
jgi:peptidoglycan/LPS O-acetylase OafA/YrhL